MIKDAFVKVGDYYYHFNDKGVMTADGNIAWKNGIELYADHDGAIDLSVLN